MSEMQQNTSGEIRKAYSPAEVEDKIYQRWQERGYFHARPNPDKKPYSIVMPPPNITGQLHMGHGLDNTIQDAIIRLDVYKRQAEGCRFLHIILQGNALITAADLRPPEPCRLRWWYI